MLLVPADQPGVDVRPIRNIAGGLEFCEVFLDDARTALDHVVGEVDGGWSVVMGTLGNERAGATVLPFQANFRREMAALLDLARARGVNGDPIVRHRLAAPGPDCGSWSSTTTGSSPPCSAASIPGPESSIGKLYWANWHQRFGELMVEVLGPDALVPGSGATSLHPMVRSFLNSRAETIYGGANEIQRNILGERVLGPPALNRRPDRSSDVLIDATLTKSSPTPVPTPGTRRRRLRRCVDRRDEARSLPRDPAGRASRPSTSPSVRRSRSHSPARR